MKEPIKSGDTCIVVGGALGVRKQPNLNREVIVEKLRGEHSEFGRIWRCRSKDGAPLVRQDPFSHQDVPVQTADFAQSWLQKVDPLPPKVAQEDRNIELID